MPGQEGTPRRTTERAGPPLPLFGLEDERIPERIGKFRILDLVAKGMAMVFKAEQEDPHRTVALKVPRGGKLLSREARDRFLREVGLAANLTHAGVVPVLEAGEIDGTPFYTMPFIEGRALDQHIEMEKPDLQTRLDLFLQVCMVVQALHAERLVHRDLKPGNIMIDRYGSVRLLDFGLAKAVSAEGTLTGDRSLLGTLQFMAPEQTRTGRHREITPAADVYALGMLLYWLLTDSVPYETGDNTEHAIRLIQRERPVPPSHVNARLGRKYDPIVLAALEKDPQDRPQTAGELGSLVQAAVRDEPMPSPLQRGRGRRIVGWLLVGVGLAMILSALAAYWWMIGQPPGDGVAMPAEEPSAPGADRAPDDSVEAEPAGRMEPRMDEEVDSARDGAEKDVSNGTPLVEPDEEFNVRVYTPSEIADLTSGRPPAEPERPLPGELWAVYGQAQSRLRDEYALRRHGAVLIHLVGAGGGGADLTWWAEGSEKTTSRSVEPGGAVAVFLPAGQPHVFESMVAGDVQRRTVSATAREVTYVRME